GERSETARKTMSDIQLYPDGEQRRRIMDFIMAAGQTLLENGAEVFRVEQTMQIMARSLHLREFHVYVLTNGIFASAGTAEISEIGRAPSELQSRFDLVCRLLLEKKKQ